MTQDLCKNENSYIDRIYDLIKDKNLTATVVTFGCQMNSKDSEKLIGVLEKSGYKIIEDEEKADFVLFNTCTVRENANQRLYGRIGQLKNSCCMNKNKIVGICGCMMQEKDEVEYINQKFKYIKLIFGTHNLYDFPHLLYDVLRSTYIDEDNKKVFNVLDESDVIFENLPQHRKYSFKAGVNIMYGCDNFCSYCIVPYVRGRERSRDASDILDEVKYLVNDGVKEVMLLGQNVNSYGKKQVEGISFPMLLDKVANIKGLYQVRFMTSHPKDFSDELIEVIRNNKKVARHIHLPLQSGSNKVLLDMNRKYTKEKYLELVEKIRNNIEGVSISTDIIVGFPTETHEDFLETIDVINKAKFEQTFTFVYSKRAGTKASEMKNISTEDEIKKRFDCLLNATKIVGEEQYRKNIGNTYMGLVEEEDASDGYLTARLSNNALVHFKADKSLIGSVVTLKLEECKGFYYNGTIQN